MRRLQPETQTRLDVGMLSEVGGGGGDDPLYCMYLTGSAYCSGW